MMVSLVPSIDRGTDDVASDNSRGPQYQSGKESDDAVNDYKEDNDTDGDDGEEAESSPSDYTVKETRSKKAQDPSGQVPTAWNLKRG